MIVALPIMKLCVEMILEIGLLLLMSQMNEACLDLLVRSFNQVFTPVIETSENRVHKSHHVDDLTNYYKQDENGNFVLRDDKWLSANPFVKSVMLRGRKTRRKYKPSGRSLFEHLNLAARTLPDGEDDIEYQWTDDEIRDDFGSSINQTNTTTSGRNYEIQDDFGSSTNQSNVVTSGRRVDIQDDYRSSTNQSNLTSDENIVDFRKSMPDKDDNGVQTNARKILIAPESYEYEDDYSEIDDYSQNEDDDLFPSERKPRYYVPGDRPLVDFLIKLLEMFQVSLANKNKGHRRLKIRTRSSNESITEPNDM